MSVFRKTRIVDGQRVPTGSYIIEIANPSGRVVRFATGLSSPKLAQAMELKITKLREHMIAGEPPSPALVEWIVSLRGSLRDDLSRHNFIDRLKTGSADPLTKHLAEWREQLEQDRNGAEHIEQWTNAVANIAEAIGAKRYEDMDPRRISKTLTDWKDREKRPIGDTTFNRYVTALRAFGKWMVEDRRALMNCGAEIRRIRKPKILVKRRAPTFAELSALVRTTWAGPAIDDVPGKERALAYWLAAETAIRQAVVLALTPADFHLTAKPAYIRVRKELTKHQQHDEKPPITNPALITALLDHLKGRRRRLATPVLRLPRRPVDALRDDLLAAGLAFETDAGRFDFHALKKYYATRLLETGADAKVLQKGAMHETPGLALEVYTDAEYSRLVGFVEKMPRVTLAG